MVFIPILVMELEAGQLFRDIAVAISVSVLLSLLVAVTVIPALSSRLLAAATGRCACRSSTTGRGLQLAGDGYVRLTVRFRLLGLILVTAIGAGAAPRRSPSCPSSNTCPRATATWSSAC
jgi:HAE1 family hydrophobic/amphiphilic exporter-1